VLFQDLRGLRLLSPHGACSTGDSLVLGSRCERACLGGLLLHGLMELQLRRASDKPLGFRIEIGWRPAR